MKQVILAIVLAVGVTAPAQKQPTSVGAKQRSAVESRIRGLEERLASQQFEIDQLKKELLVRDEEVHALMELIQSEENKPTEDPSNDFEFESQAAACHLIRYVRSFSTANKAARQRRIFIIQRAIN